LGNLPLEYRRKRQQELREKGICLRCWKRPAEKSKRMCSVCLEKASRRSRKLRKNPIWHSKELKKRREYWAILRMEAMEIIAKGEPRCIVCGCDDLRVLEINHKIPCGKEGHRRTYKFLLDLVKGRIDPNLFDIRCKVCNILYSCELDFNLSWKIVFLGPNIPGKVVPNFQSEQNS